MSVCENACRSSRARPSGVQFELTFNTREYVLAWIKSPEMFACPFMFPRRFHDRPHISIRQYGRLVNDWVTAIGLEPSGYGTHSLRRTKAAEIYRTTGNLRAVQLLFGHTMVDSTVRYELEDALSIAMSWQKEGILDADPWLKAGDDWWGVPIFSRYNRNTGQLLGIAASNTH